jgi:hypothetical protein
MRDIWGLGRDKKKVEAALPSAGVLCTGVCCDIVTAKNFTDAVEQKLHGSTEPRGEGHQEPVAEGSEGGANP